jgi:flagellar hook-length control protein FliK
LSAAPARVEAVASTAGAAQSAPLAGQLARPIFTLAAAGPGSHTMTISVTPDALGPVTVRAHVGPEGIRVELFAPTDVGRDAIRTILPDLRKDLAGTGLGASLDLSSQNQPSDHGQNALNTQNGRGGENGEGAQAGDDRERRFAVPAGIVSDIDTSESSANRPGASTIDVMV